MTKGVTRGLRASKMAALFLVFSACYNVGEYRLPDGGLAPHDGDGCPCGDVQTRIEDAATGELVVECVPTELVNDNDPTTVCLGARCCQWRAP